MKRRSEIFYLTSARAFVARANTTRPRQCIARFFKLRGNDDDDDDDDDVFNAGGSAERSRPPRGHAACRRLSVLSVTYAQYVHTYCVIPRISCISSLVAVVENHTASVSSAV